MSSSQKSCQYSLLPHPSFSLFQLTSKPASTAAMPPKVPLASHQCPPSLVLAHQSLLVMLMLSGIFCLLSPWVHPPLKYLSEVTPFPYSSSHALLDHIITSSFVLVILKYISLLLQIQSSSVSVYTQSSNCRIRISTCTSPRHLILCVCKTDLLSLPLTGFSSFAFYFFCCRSSTRLPLEV